MKKFISMTIAAIMAASIVPSTAFAANEEIAKIKTVGAIKWNTEEAKAKKNLDAVELQISLKDFSHSFNNKNEVFELELDFDGAYVTTYNPGQYEMNEYTLSGVYRDGVRVDGPKIYLNAHDEKDTTLEFEIHENGFDFHKDDKIIIVAKDLRMDRYSEGAKAVVDVTGDFGEATDLPVAAIYGNGFKVDYSNKLTEIAVESEKELKTITIESKVGKFSNDEEIKVKINSDFEISKFEATMIEGGIYKDGSFKDNEEFVIIPFDDSEEITIKGLEIESLDEAKPGDIAKFEVRCKSYDTAYVEVAKVVADEVIVTVDEDEDVPVMYSGTDSEYTNLDCGDSHDALTVTIEEVTVGSWDTKKAWSLTLPEGVYVTDKTKIDTQEHISTDKYSSLTTLFEHAYADKDRGNYEGFEFPRHSITIDKDEKAKLEFTLNLVAEPSFEGNVDLTFDNGEFKETVTIAKFVKPYKVEVKQNDVAVDYRYTTLESGITVIEPEEGLWKNGTEFDFQIEKNIKFEDTEKYVSNFDIKERSGSTVGFVTKEQSDEEPFKVEIKDLSVYMERNLPAGGYDLIVQTNIDKELMSEEIFGSDKIYDDVCDMDNWNEKFENFVNIVTGDADTFVTKVEVPVGKDYIKAGDKVFTLDVPAYINAENYTMLPVRAVAVALGIDNNAIIWNAETHTATIFYGSRIISMTVGADVMTVNGTTIPTATSVEIVNGRMFIPMRDLATAMNAKLDWDPVTRTAYFN